MERAVLALRQAHPAWDGRKLQRRLARQGYQGIPSPSTITAILHRLALEPRGEALGDAVEKEVQRLDGAQIPGGKAFGAL